MSTLIVNTITFLIAGAGCLVVGALVLNNLPLGDPPGLMPRLKAYFSENSAETRRDHPFPELELRCYRTTPQALFPRVEHALQRLAWDIIDSDPHNHHLRAVIETPLLKFKDDIEIQLQLADCGTELHVRAQSRIGRGDLGANTRHILDLYDALARQA